jgi:hypothetical protein
MGKRIDLPEGFESGLLTVIEKADNHGQWSAHLCDCTCGRQISVKSSMLYRRRVQSCGCLRTMIALAHSVSDCKDITGKRYGHLTVLERDYGKMCSNKSTVSWWICLCDCGNIKSIRKTYLSSKVKSKGCGCMKIKKGKYDHNTSKMGVSRNT